MLFLAISCMLCIVSSDPVAEFQEGGIAFKNVHVIHAGTIMPQLRPTFESITGDHEIVIPISTAQQKTTVIFAKKGEAPIYFGKLTAMRGGGASGAAVDYVPFFEAHGAAPAAPTVADWNTKLKEGFFMIDIKVTGVVAAFNHEYNIAITGRTPKTVRETKIEQFLDRATPWFTFDGYQQLVPHQPPMSEFDLGPPLPSRRGPIASLAGLSLDEQMERLYAQEYPQLALQLQRSRSAPGLARLFMHAPESASTGILGSEIDASEAGLYALFARPRTVSQGSSSIASTESQSAGASSRGGTPVGEAESVSLGGGSTVGGSSTTGSSTAARTEINNRLIDLMRYEEENELNAKSKRRKRPRASRRPYSQNMY